MSRTRSLNPQSRSSRQDLVVDAETSARLGRIRQHGTSAELTIRKLLYSLGHRFRVFNRGLPGSPDIANRSRKWVVFVHGCFWHRHSGCKRSTTPTRNRAFWLEKFEANVARDARVQTALREKGYRVIVVWECETENVNRLKTLRRVLARLS